jgi:hypothetical protein
MLIFAIQIESPQNIRHPVSNCKQKSATTSRAGGMRMAPGRGRGHLCWGTLIFKRIF